MIDIEKLRAETPGCQQVLHFNNAGAALSPTPVIDAIKHHLDLEAMIGGYEAAHAESNKIESFYDRVAQLINCDREEIAFAENATRAWDMAFYSLKFKAGDCIITSTSEYISNYLSLLQIAKHTGAHIEIIRNDASGQLDIEDLQNKVNDKVKLIAITHVPSQGGLINPAVEVGKIANKMNIPYLLDAAQSIGQMPIDVKAIGCDFLCATGRKFLRGPRATGFLYVKKSRIAQCEPPFINFYVAKWTADDDYVIRSDARRFETSEQNMASKIGLSIAIEYALTLGLPIIWDRIQFLAQKLRQQLQEISSIELHDLGLHQCGIVTFASKNKSAIDIQKQLAKRKMNTVIRLPEDARLDMMKRNSPALVRASIHYYNTEDEIERFCREVKAIVA